ncbi:MAG: NAD(P)H-dependent glycerol-3-phosphate dehydrogenase [Holosporales bacterium]|jgi:glycerol-3-phosphate dehydrogenase (NAD(P)+)|nr:NAD(P)H-dependent glycerol-3-phosphate dehydrogenase [Holosporales bacterium]
MASHAKSIGILGAGAFGTALALVFSKNFNVTLFSCFDEHVEMMVNNRINEFLSDVTLPDNINIKATKHLEKSVFDYLFWVFPVAPSIDILDDIKDKLDGTTVVIGSKGLSVSSQFLLSVFETNLPNSRIAYLAGPNFAADLAFDKMAAADVATRSLTHATSLASELSTETFKLYPTDDIIGIQICGAMKNVIAIACGISDGLNLGASMHAAILSFAIAEMKGLGIKLGARETTFYGLCGIGDLVLTSSSALSRNMSFGMRIAQGEKIDYVLSKNKAVCEGYDSVSHIVQLAKQNQVELSICNTVHDILFCNSDPKSIINVFK